MFKFCIWHLPSAKLVSSNVSSATFSENKDDLVQSYRFLHFSPMKNETPEMHIAMLHVREIGLFNGFFQKYLFFSSEVRNIVTYEVYYEIFLAFQHQNNLCEIKIGRYPSSKDYFYKSEFQVLHCFRH